jgi:hypothetical protein
MQHVPNRDNGFFALLGHDRELDLALLDIENSISLIPLRKNNLPLGERQHGFPLADCSEKALGVKPRGLSACYQ